MRISDFFSCLGIFSLFLHICPKIINLKHESKSRYKSKTKKFRQQFHLFFISPAKLIIFKTLTEKESSGIPFPIGVVNPALFRNPRQFQSIVRYYVGRYRSRIHLQDTIVGLENGKKALIIKLSFIPGND